MKISDIKEQKNKKDRFSIFLDGEYAFSLSGSDLLDSKLRIGSELDSLTRQNLEKKSADSLLLAKAYDKCLRRPHSEKEIRDYLWKQKTEEELTDHIIGKCYDLKLLNDEDFAIRWVEHRRRANKSGRFIQNELVQKGIDKSIIEDVLDSDDKDELRAMIEKKRSKYPNEKKLIAYLQRQGFSYYDIREALTDEVD